MTETEDDWVEVERLGTRTIDQLSDITLKLSTTWGKDRRNLSRASFAFRRAAANWIMSRAKRYRVQIGGALVNQIRFMPDNLAGRFERSKRRSGTVVIQIGNINAWPSEDRVPTPCEWKIVNGAMIITAPEDWATPKHASTSAALSDADHRKGAKR